MKLNEKIKLKKLKQDILKQRLQVSYIAWNDKSRNWMMAGFDEAVDFLMPYIELSYDVSEIEDETKYVYYYSHNNSFAIFDIIKHRTSQEYLASYSPSHDIHKLFCWVGIL